MKYILIYLPGSKHFHIVSERSLKSEGGLGKYTVLAEIEGDLLNSVRDPEDIYKEHIGMDLKVLVEISRGAVSMITTNTPFVDVLVYDHDIKENLTEGERISAKTFLFTHTSKEEFDQHIAELNA
jgi:hypothetical protein